MRKDKKELIEETCKDYLYYKQNNKVSCGASAEYHYVFNSGVLSGICRALSLEVCETAEILIIKYQKSGRTFLEIMKEGQNE